MIRLACMTWPYAQYSFERALIGIAGAGYRYVSFGLPHEGKQVFDASVPGEAERIRRLLDKYNLQPVTLISTDALAPDIPFECAVRRMEFACELGVTELLSLGVSGYREFPDDPLRPEELAHLSEAFNEKFRHVAEEAGKRGLVVSVKPHTGNTAAAREINETLQQIASAHVKVSYDPGNVRFYEGIDPAIDIQGVANNVVSLIAKDHRGARAEEDFPIPGEGDVDFPLIFSTLRSAGFAGPVIVERFDGRGASLAADKLDERAKMARVNLERIVADAGYLFES